MSYTADHGRGGTDGYGGYQSPGGSGAVPSRPPGTSTNSFPAYGGQDPGRRPPAARPAAGPGGYGDSFGARGGQRDSFGVGPAGPPGIPGGNYAAPGDMVGDRYQLVDLVGKGGNGTVWRANDTVLRREVALKEVFLPTDLPPAERQHLIDRSMREAQIAAGLSHPSVIRVFDVVEHRGLPWIVMELLQARSLADILTTDGALPPRVAAKIGLALVGALQAAHEAGIIHRDVKPGNVLISADGRCVLSDFGAAQMNQMSNGTSPGKVLGSAHYIAPERAVGHPAEPASDVFSLGVTLYAAVEGRPPFDRGDAVATMRAVVQDPPESPRGAGPLTPLLGGMLAKDPLQRFSLGRVRQELAALLAGPLASGNPVSGAPMSGIPASAPPSRPVSAAPQTALQSAPPQQSPPRRAPARDREPPKSGKAKGFAIAAVFLLVVLGLGFMLYLWQFAGGAPDDSGAPTTPGETTQEEEEPQLSFEPAVHEGSGFSAHYPSTWVSGEDGQDYVEYRNADDPTHWIRFYSDSSRILQPTIDGWLTGYFASLSNSMHDLEQRRLDPVEFGGMSGSVLEYTGVNNDGNSERHSIWAIVDAGDGTGYGVFISGPDSGWGLSQEVYDEALRSFQTD